MEPAPSPPSPSPTLDAKRAARLARAAVRIAETWSRRPPRWRLDDPVVILTGRRSASPVRSLNRGRAGVRLGSAAVLARAYAAELPVEVLRALDARPHGAPLVVCVAHDGVFASTAPPVSPGALRRALLQRHFERLVDAWLERPVEVLDIVVLLVDARTGGPLARALSAAHGRRGRWTDTARASELLRDHGAHLPPVVRRALAGLRPDVPFVLCLAHGGLTTFNAGASVGGVTAVDATELEPSPAEPAPVEPSPRTSRVEVPEPPRKVPFSRKW